MGLYLKDNVASEKQTMTNPNKYNTGITFVPIIRRTEKSYKKREGKNSNDIYYIIDSNGIGIGIYYCFASKQSKEDYSREEE